MLYIRIEKSWLTCKEHKVVYCLTCIVCLPLRLTPFIEDDGDIGDDKEADDESADIETRRFRLGESLGGVARIG